MERLLFNFTPARCGSPAPSFATGQPDQPLHDPDFPSYHFDVITGLRYRIDLCRRPRFGPGGSELRPGTSRIVDLTHAGKAVRVEMEFNVATNNYRVSGGANFPGAGGDTIGFDAPDTNRDVIMRHIAKQETINPATRPVWSFAPMPGTSALFETGPRARHYAAGLTRPRIEAAGDAPGGCARFPIRL